MASTNCIYKSVTMGAGEVFVLPPGAVLISVSDAGAVTSSCPGDLPEVPMKCYKIRWVLNLDPEGGRGVASPLGTASVQIPEITNAWEDDDEGAPLITVENIGGGGQIVNAGSISCRSLGAIETVINNSPISGIMAERKYFSDHAIGALTTLEILNWLGASNFRSGYTWFELYFKAPEVLGKTIYLEFGGGADNIGSIPRQYPIEIDCDDYPTDPGLVVTC